MHTAKQSITTRAPVMICNACGSARYFMSLSLPETLDGSVFRMH